jgi:hypothetical protein
MFKRIFIKKYIEHVMHESAIFNKILARGSLKTLREIPNEGIVASS